MSTHLATLRLMRLAAVGDNLAALGHAIAVLEACEALNREALSDDHVAVMGPHAEEPTWEVRGIEASSIEGVLVAYAESLR